MERERKKERIFWLATLKDKEIYCDSKPREWKEEKKERGENSLHPIGRECKVRERNLPHSDAKHSTFDDDLDPLTSRLAPFYLLHPNTCKRDQKKTRDTRAYIV